MKYKILHLLLPGFVHTIVTLIYFVVIPTTVEAQKPDYTKPRNNSEVPFGKKQPPPSTYQRNEMYSKSDWMDYHLLRKSDHRASYTAFDSISNQPQVLRPEKQFTELRPPEIPYLRSTREGKKEKNLVTDFHLTKDINRISDSYPANSRVSNTPASFAVSKGVSYFAAEDGIHGRELWRSDGTNKGTYLFKDLNPGEGASNPMEITPMNNKLFFNAYDFHHGEELWVSDGTSAGTQMLVDVYPGPEGSRPGQIVGIGNTIFFVTSPGYYNYNVQLWKTDGSQEGTSLLFDVANTSASSSIFSLTRVNNLLFFSVASYTLGVELWRSDGTRQGTFPVKNFGNNFWGLMHLTSYNDKLFFSADDGTGRKLWISDGTDQGTLPAPGDNSVSLTAYYYSKARIPFQQIGNSLFIFGYSNSDGSGLFKYDASTGRGMELVKSFTSESYPPIIQAEIALSRGILYFKLMRGVANLHDELWRSDGTPANTKLVKAFSPGIPFTTDYYSHDGNIYFTRYDDHIGQELWTSDGTPEGTKLLKDILTGPDASNPSYFTSINGKLIFNARNETGAELWITNGTEAGTIVLKDINTHSTAGSNAGAYSGMAALGRGVVYPAYDYEHGEEIYTSDGSDKGTFLLKDINAQPRQPSYPHSFVSKKNDMYFLAYRSDSSGLINGIYKTDGTSRKTVKVADIERTYIVSYNVADNGMVFYAGYDGMSGTYALWRTDGTVLGTYMLTNNFYYSSDILVEGKHAYFVAGNPESGYELWKSDGSKVGTKMIKDIYPGNQGSYPFSLVPFNDQVYFGAYDGQISYSFWKSDGTDRGTIKLKTISPAFFNYRHENRLFSISNGFLYFVASDYSAIPYQANELWKTDGTAEGTKLVKEINPNYDAYPTYLTDVDGTLFFLADDGTHGYELWSTDGSEPGTRMLKDISPAGSYQDLSTLTSAGGRLFFLKGRGSEKSELWSSDGTTENTRPVSDDELEKITSIYNIVGVKDKLFLSGYSYKYGTELYASDIKEKSKRLSSIEAKYVPLMETSLPFTVTLFPNPAKTASALRFNGNVSFVSVTITDITGKVIWKKAYTKITQISLPIEKLAAGLYVVAISNHSEVKTIKLVKQ